MSSKERSRMITKRVRAWRNKIEMEPAKERLGTYDTCVIFEQYHPEHIVRKKDGTPDFKAERKVVSYLKNKTLRKKQDFIHQQREIN